jgi:hypothetical protein
MITDPIVAPRLDVRKFRIDVRAQCVLAPSKDNASYRISTDLAHPHESHVCILLLEGLGGLAMDLLLGCKVQSWLRLEPKARPAEVTTWMRQQPSKYRLLLKLRS